MFKKGKNLYDHQIDALKFIKEHGRSLLALPTGSGKSLIAITLFRLLRKSSLVEVYMGYIPVHNPSS